MAKAEYSMEGDFQAVLDALNNGILQGSMTASLEESSECTLGDVRCAVRVYERYSALGGNRLSLSLVLLGRGRELRLTAVTAGGSQAMFFKINTWGEDAFLSALHDVVCSLPAEHIREGLQP